MAENRDEMKESGAQPPLADDSRRKLIELHRMAEIGRVASWVAHEFNNLLGGMLGYAELAAMSGDLEDYRRLSTVVSETCNRGRRLTGGLLYLTLRPLDNADLTSPSQLFEEVFVLLERRFKKIGIQLEQHIQADAIVRTNIGRLQQILFLILLATADRLPDGGTLRVTSNHGGAGEFQIVFTDNGSLPGKCAIDCHDVSLLATESERGFGYVVADCLLREAGGCVTLAEGGEGGVTCTVSVPCLDLAAD